MPRIQLYDPFADAPFEDIVRSFLRPVRNERSGQQTQQSFHIDVNEDDKSYVVTADLPGVVKDDIQVTIDGNQVTIAAEVKRNVERKEGERALHVERYVGQLFRTFTLPTEIDESASEAKFENGVLDLRLAKKTPQAGRKLSIQ
jgi:HSP20 family protein